MTVELLIVLFEFVFACVTFTSGDVVSILAVVLSLFNVVIASLDGFLYFIEGGSCMSLFKWAWKKFRGKENKGEMKVTEEGETEEGKEERENGGKCGQFRKKARKAFAVGSEVLRVSVTELLLYPVTVLDFYELIDSQTYNTNSYGDRINFSLLNIGLFYLVLTVYVIRILMAVSAVVSLSRLPKTTHSDYQNLLRKFALHIVGQILVHATILVMVATKIESEVCASVEEDGNGSGSGLNGTITESVNASPYLITAMITGNFIPFLGVAMFFVVNYPALKQFMMGFCIDMMSTIVAEDFASTAFSGTGIKNVKRKASEVGTSLTSVRQKYNLYTNVFSFKKKLSYRLTNPLVMIFSIAYFSLVTVYLVCHAVGWSDPCDSSSGVVFVRFDSHPGEYVTFFIGLTVIALANYQVVLMSVIWLLALSGLVLFVVTAPLTIMLLVPLIATVALVKSCI